MYKPCLQILLAASMITLAISNLSAQMRDDEVLRGARRNLIPVPASVVWKDGRLVFTRTFSVAVKGQTDERLRAYIFRVMRRLEGRTVLELSHELSNDAANVKK